MFNKENSDKTFNGSATLISAGTLIKGDVKSENDLRIDGTIQGNVITASKIVIGPSGLVEGNIFANGADITGKVVGNIEVKELLQLRAESKVEGNICASSLQVDPAAVFNGKCQMGEPAGSVVLMNNMDGKTAEAN
jgi:cytoskeletal protein CcmA (bactofilin family)